MLSIILTERGCEPQLLEFDKNEVTVGRVQGNDIVLAKGNVSKRHCRFAAKDGRVVVVDLESTNGTYVNGRKITAPYRLRANDRVYLGDFVIQIAKEGQGPVRRAGPETLQQGPVTAPEGRPTQPQRAVRLSEELAEVPESLSVEVGSDTPRAPPSSAVTPPEPEAPAGSAGDAKPEAERVTLVGPARASGTLVGHGESELPSEPPAPGLRGTLIAPGGAPLAPPVVEESGEPQGRGEGETRRPTAPIAAAAAKRSTMFFRPGDPRPETPSVAPAGPSALQREVYDRVADSADLRLVENERLDEAALRARAEQAIAAVIRDMTAQGRIPNSMDRLILSRNVLREIVGLGPLEDMLADDELSDILIDRPDQIHVVRNGQLERCEQAFSSERAAAAVIDRLLASAGARPESGPLLDLRLPDGARVTAVMQPLALRGAAVTIRKHRRQNLTLEQLVDGGMLSSAMADLLWAALAARQNVLFTGAAGSGKTTLLSALAAFLPPQERVLCVEDSEELQAAHDLWIQFDCGEGKDPNLMRDLVRSALRMLPDRMVVGELRGGETWDLVQAMRTGLDGVLATVYAESPHDALERLEQWVRGAHGRLESSAAREMLAATIGLVVHLGRFTDSVRRVTRISEVRGVREDGVQLRDVFVLADGRFGPTGVVPGFLADQDGPDALVDPAIFSLPDQNAG